MKTIISMLVVGAAIAVAATARAAGPYVLTDFGTSAEGNSAVFAFGINNYGQVTGSTGLSLGGRAFLWTPAAPNGTSGSLMELGLSPNEGRSINDYGQVVGCSGGCNPGSPSPASLWTPTTPNGTTGAWASLLNDNMAAARGINARGQVVGTGMFTIPQRAFLWSPTTPNGTSGASTNLGVAASNSTSQGWGINNYGQVVGSGNHMGGPDRRATLWTPTTANGTSGSWIRLTSFDSFGDAINTMGQAVGSNLSTGTTFLWSPTTPNGTTGAVSDLGKLPGSSETNPWGINSNGSVVGGTSGSNSRASLWEPNVPNGGTGTLFDLNTLLSPADDFRWHLQSARGINDLGQIVGYGLFDADGPGGAAAVPRAFLLTPVPEPGTFLLIVWASLPAALVGYRRRQRI